MHPLLGRPSRSSVVRVVTASAVLAALRWWRRVARRSTSRSSTAIRTSCTRCRYQAYQRHHWDDAVVWLREADPRPGRARHPVGAVVLLPGRGARAQGRAAACGAGFFAAGRRISRTTRWRLRRCSRAGHAYEHLWRRPDLDDNYGQSALAEFQTLLALYPTSPLKDRAEQQVAHLQEWFAEKDYLNGLHYFHRKAYDSSIIYFKDVVKNYPNVPITREAYLRLVEAYQKIRYKDDADDVCNTLRVTYPHDPEVLHRKCAGSRRRARRRRSRHRDPRAGGPGAHRDPRRHLRSAARRAPDRGG